jgi:hypothetical protein
MQSDGAEGDEVRNNAGVQPTSSARSYGHRIEHMSLGGHLGSQGL